MDSLLVEIGVEEIPAGYIKPAISTFAAKLSRQLARGNIKHGDIKTFSTPRRLAVLVEDLVSKRKPIITQVCGPSLDIALDDLGNYTIPACKFAEKVGVSLDQLVIISNHKGKYIGIEKKGLGEETISFLERILPDLILSIPFPKTMKWSASSIRFARPIRTLVAILGKNIVNFLLDKRIRSGRSTTGHLFMSPSSISIDSPENYLDLMRGIGVIADFEERRNLVFEAINEAAASVGGKIFNDDVLLDIVTNLVEYPVAVAGNFDDSFLTMPKEILVMAMREHQKYFSVVDDRGGLLPNFIAVNNTLANDMRLVTVGHERVLKARLSDTKFFFETDVGTSLDFWLSKLKKVLFHSDLGSMHDKTFRIKTIASYLAEIVAPEIKNEVIRSACLCKVDLVSQVVMEFPRLQGVMGGVYANLSGESDKVSLAIKEHYLPTKSGGLLPKSKIGSLISIADKLDSICGGFIVDLAPTGDADPYALRRQALGLLRILHNMSFDLSLDKLVELGLEGYKSKTGEDFTLIGKKICEFLINRLCGLLRYDGYSSDVIDAVIAVTSNNIVDVYRRVSAIENFKKTRDFSLMITAFKRVARMLQKANITYPDITEKLFKDYSEVMLYEACQNVNIQVDVFLRKNAIFDCLTAMIVLCEPLTLFFDKVRVMVDDDNLRCNRLALLNCVIKIFGRVGDFSKFSL